MSPNAVDVLFGSDLGRLTTSGFVDSALDRTLDAADIRGDVRATQRLLDRALKLAPGAVVAIPSEPASSFVVSFLAVLGRRLIAVPLDAQQSHGELTRRVELVGAQALLQGHVAPGGFAWATAAGLPILTADATAVAGPPSRDYPPDAAMVLFTSGSTGASKAAVITHAGLISNALATAEWQTATPTDVIAGTISLFHCFAILHTVLAPLLSGAAVVAMAPFSPTKTVAAARQHALSLLPGTPAMFEILLRHPTVSRADWRALRCGFSGGAALRPETQARFLDVFGAPLLNGYGITEATSFVTAPAIGGSDQLPYSIGRPVRGVSCRVGHPNAEDGSGELEIGGDSVMAGYLADPAATRAVITGDGWLRTGDQVRISSSGELFYVGRLKNVINRGGEKIHPEHIEAALADAKWVRHLVAVGVPDRILGERIAVVIESASEQFNEAELRSRADQRLARHERPDWYIRVDQIPRTPTGKLSLTDAWELAARQIGETMLAPK